MYPFSNSIEVKAGDSKNNSNEFKVHIIKAENFIPIKIVALQIIHHWLTHLLSFGGKYAFAGNRMDWYEVALGIRRLFLDQNDFDLFVLSENNVVQGLALCSDKEQYYNLRLLLSAPYNFVKPGLYDRNGSIGTALLSAIVQHVSSDDKLRTLDLKLTPFESQARVSNFYRKRMFKDDFSTKTGMRLGPEEFEQFLTKYTPPTMSSVTFIPNNEYIKLARSVDEFYYIYISGQGDEQSRNHLFKLYFETDASERNFGYDEKLFKDLFEYMITNNLTHMINLLIDDPSTKNRDRILALVENFKLVAGPFQEVMQQPSASEINFEPSFDQEDMHLFFEEMQNKKIIDVENWMRAIKHFLDYLVQPDEKKNFFIGNFDLIKNVFKDLDATQIQQICNSFELPSVADMKTTYTTNTSFLSLNHYRLRLFNNRYSETSYSFISYLREQANNNPLGPSAKTLTTIYRSPHKKSPR